MLTWYSATRRYFYNTIPPTWVKQSIKEMHIKHVFFIMDMNFIDNVFKNKYKELLTDFITDNNYTKVYFVIIRPYCIPKKITKQYKSTIRTMCREFNWPENRYSVFATSDFHIKYAKSIDKVYRISPIPNSLSSDFVHCYDMNDKQPLLRIAGTIDDSIVDGIGMRYVVFTQGCPHHCEECHNPETWGYKGGQFVTVQDLVKQIIQNPLLNGITFSGGEPFMQPYALYELIRELEYYYKSKNKRFNYTAYTGFKLSDLQNLRTLLESKKYRTTTNTLYKYKLLSKLDYIVDGKFEKDKKTMNCKFRGSYNQKMYERTGPTNDDFEEIYPYKNNS